MKQFAYSIAVIAAVVSSSSGALAQLQERPQIPREWYANVVLWAYGESRPARYAEGCLRWGTHTRTWYDICRNQPNRVIGSRY